jgi:arylsulfatase
LALTAVDFPPMQDPASFNLSALKAEIEEMRRQAQSAHPGN